MRTPRFISNLSITLLSSILLIVSALGQVALSPVAVSTTIRSFNDTVPPANLINQSGVTTPFTSNVTMFDAYFANPGQTFATSGDGGTNNWQSDTAFDLGYQGFLDFDLGAVYQINRLAIWNRSLSNITVKILSEPAGSEQIAGTFTLLNRQSFNFSYAVEILDFNATFTGRYVRFDINGVYPFQGFNFGNASAGEIVVSALPLGETPPILTIVKESSGDVKLTFTGRLQASPSPDGVFTNLPANLTSPLTLLQKSLLPRQFFRAQANQPGASINPAPR